MSTKFQNILLISNVTNWQMHDMAKYQTPVHLRHWIYNLDNAKRKYTVYIVSHFNFHHDLGAMPRW